MEPMPKIDGAAFRERMRAAFERAMQEVADSIDAAPCGRIIRDSEEPSREALDRFRQAAYETAIQMKVEAAEAAFPPSGERNDQAPAAK
jgi:hypothetical protein